MRDTAELFDLTGKVVIVTGSTKGIGRAMVEGLARAGASVVVSSRKQDLWAIAEEVQPAAFFEKPYDSKQLLDGIAVLLSRTCPLTPERNLSSSTPLT